IQSPGYHPNLRTQPRRSLGTAPCVSGRRRPQSMQYSWPGSRAAPQRGQWRSIAVIASSRVATSGLARADDHRVVAARRIEHAPAVRAEVRAAQDRGAARAVRHLPVSVQQVVDLSEAAVDPDDLGAALGEQVLAE